MLSEFIAELGPWVWLIVGFVLLIMEVLVPGVFLLWFGLAALVIGSLTLVPFADVAWWPWQAQAVAFAALSLLFAVIGTRIFPSHGNDTAGGGLNDRGGQLRGRTATLIEPIENGSGRIRIGDTVWRVEGPDLDEGAKVRITGADGGTLKVEAA